VEEVNLFNILIHAAVLYAVFKFGQFTVIHKLAKDMVERLQKGEITEDEVKRSLGIEDQEDEPVAAKETLMEVERVGTAYFAYSAEGQFLAQGQDFRSLLEAVRKQHPGRNFRLNKYQPTLTEEESGRLVKSIFEVYGDKNEKT
jgi:hypothetical protein